MSAVDDVSSFTEADTSEDEVVESLVAGRQKRVTAGRNMSSLLDAAADDDLTLLFAEDENDDEFDEDEGADGEFDDMRLDSSSEDEDDQGPNAGDDDLEGEKELEKQARVDRKKRKAQESLRLTALRKKVKIDPNTATSVPTAVPRPKKKSERVSWLPTPEEGPVRSSSRRQTMQNKEMTHARLKDSEQRRIKLIATMEEAAKRKLKSKRRVMTQEERLAEAEKIERLNSKSLNRWEEMEKRKAEERKAKLEALQNRRLEGPVISWWSGMAKWINGKLVRVGNVEVKPKVEKEEAERKKKTKDAAARENSKTDIKAAEGLDVSLQQASDAPPTEGSSGPAAVVPAESAVKQDDTVDQTQQGEKVTSSLGLLDGIHQYASLPITSAPETQVAETKAPESVVSKPESKQNDDNDDAASGKLQVEESRSNGEKLEATLQTDTPDEKGRTEDTSVVEVQPVESLAGVSEEEPQGDSKPSDGMPDAEILPDMAQAGPMEIDAGTTEETQKPAGENAESRDVSGTAAVEEAKPLEPVIASSEAEPEQQPQTEQSDAPIQEAASTPEAVVPKPTETMATEMDIDQPVSAAEPTLSEIEAAARPEDIEQTGRNVLVLENFDNSTMHSRKYSIYFNSKKPPRLTKISSHLCPITSQLSRYRDPDTGLPYANVVGYREIRNLIAQKYTWSGMLGCYVGSANVAAKGVPEQFITGIKPAKTKSESTSDPAAASGVDNDEKKEKSKSK